MPLSNLENIFTFESLLEALKLHYKKTNEEIRILSYITDLKPEELYDSMKRFGFDIIQHGSIVEVKTGSISIEEEIEGAGSERLALDILPSISIYYCHYDYERNLLLCFTSEALEETEKNIGRFVEQRSRITSLWISPLIFSKIMRQIISENENSIISEFHASRFMVDSKEVIRENFDRYFRYTGDDGRYTLDEISRAYGVLPTSVKFIIPNISKFWITNKGKFTFIHGDIDFLFNIINNILSYVLKTKSLIDKAKIEFIPVDMGIREVKLPKVIPLEIMFSREIDYSEIEKLVDNMKGEDFNFEIYDMLLLPGSIHLSGTVVERNKNGEFNITGNLNKLTISPRKDTTFDSMLQFYKMIVERLDANAQLQISNPSK